MTSKLPYEEKWALSHFKKSKVLEGLPWRSSGQDSALPLLGPWVRFPGQGTKIPHTSSGVAKKIF